MSKQANIASQVGFGAGLACWMFLALALWDSADKSGQQGLPALIFDTGAFFSSIDAQNVGMVFLAALAAMSSGIAVIAGWIGVRRVQREPDTTEGLREGVAAIILGVAPLCLAICALLAGLAFLFFVYAIFPISSGGNWK